MKKYIDAEGVMRACYDSFLKTGNKAYREIFALVEAVPAEDVAEVRHGRWVEFSPLRNMFSCSLCGQWGDRLWNYCPNCGAIMDKEENE